MGKALRDGRDKVVEGKKSIIACLSLMILERVLAVKCGWGWRETVARGYKFPGHISTLPPSHLRINWLKSKLDFQLNSAPCSSNFVS